VIRQAKEQEMGVVLMRVSTRCGSWTSGIFQRLMAGGSARRFEIDAVANDSWSGPAAAHLCGFQIAIWT
jgi:hypothetical protein